MYRNILLLVLFIAVAVVGTVGLNLMYDIPMLDGIFMMSMGIVFIAVVVYIPLRQFIKDIKNAEKQKAFTIEHYVVYAKNRVEAEEKVKAIKQNFKDREEYRSRESMLN